MNLNLLLILAIEVFITVNNRPTDIENTFPPSTLKVHVGHVYCFDFEFGFVVVCIYILMWSNYFKEFQPTKSIRIQYRA